MSDKPRKFVTRRSIEELFAEGVPVNAINSDVVEVAGVTLEVDHTNGQDVPTGSLLVCVPVTPALNAVYPLSEIGACSTCSRPVWYRKTAPKGLTLICIPCAAKAGYLPSR